MNPKIILIIASFICVISYIQWGKEPLISKYKKLAPVLRKVMLVCAVLDILAITGNADIIFGGLGLLLGGMIGYKIFKKMKIDGDNNSL